MVKLGLEGGASGVVIDPLGSCLPRERLNGTVNRWTRALPAVLYRHILGYSRVTVQFSDLQSVVWVYHNTGETRVFSIPLMSKPSPGLKNHGPDLHQEPILLATQDLATLATIAGFLTRVGRL